MAQRPREGARIGLEIRRRLRALGMSYQELTQRVGVNRTYVFDLISGRSNGVPRADILYRIAQVLGCEVEDLLQASFFVGRAAADVEYPGGEFVQKPEELMLLHIWRDLSDREQMEMLRLLNTIRSGRPPLRKGNNGR